VGFLMFIFGYIFWFMISYYYSVIAVLLGLILGPLADQELLKSVQIHRSDTLIVFFTRPVSLILIIITVISVLTPVIISQIKKRRKTAEHDIKEYLSMSSTVKTVTERG